MGAGEGMVGAGLEAEAEVEVVVEVEDEDVVEGVVEDEGVVEEEGVVDEEGVGVVVVEATEAGGRKSPRFLLLGLRTESEPEGELEREEPLGGCCC